MPGLETQQLTKRRGRGAEADSDAIRVRDAGGAGDLPHIVLSEENNPLTAPIPLPVKTSHERAAERFSVEGNAIVTGGSGGLGLPCVRALLEHGASGVCIFDVAPSLKGAQSAIAALRRDFKDATVITKVVDVSGEKAVRAAVDAAAKELGSVDIMLCFAGIVEGRHAIDITEHEWRRVIDINLNGSWFCAQAAARHMIAQKSGGAIILVSSISGHMINFPQPQISYNVSKAGVLHLARGLAAEWARFGIRVNSVSPGYMETAMTKGEELAEEREIWMKSNPMGRLGQPEELTGAVIMLCSKVAGQYLNGTDVVVDGGETVL
ncbi:hypothetical protein CPB85DRAFT_870465 [Mucidula mucida]|nr:hypothetical protein CPB85DRAFT_870465 [Mucidula mucida]